MLIKNTQYNPNDPKSSRWVFDNAAASQPSIASTFKSILSPITTAYSAINTPKAPVTAAPNMSVAPKNMSTAPTQPVPPLIAAISPANAPAAPAGGITVTKTNTPAAGSNGVPAPVPAGGVANPGMTATATIPVSQGMTPQELASYAGKAGLSVEEYTKFLDQSATPDSAAVNSIRESLGIPGLVDTVFAQPKKTTQAIYQDYYDQSGIGEIKNKIATLDTELSTIRNGRTQAIKEHQDNPWLSVSTRSARIAREKDLYNQREENATLLRGQYLDQYDKGVSEIEKIVGRVATDLEGERGLNADKLNYLLNEAERQVGQKASDSKKENLRYSGTYLKSRYQADLDKEARAFSRQKEIEQLKNGAGSVGVAQLMLQNMGIDPKGNSVYAELARSAGKKSTTDSFRQSFEKGVSTLGQLSDIDKAFATYKTNTGSKLDLSPITGIIRGNNPYDVKAQAIKAQLTALVPNLARGIYGEVGVLTDADIENYTKTLPNLKSTEDVRKAMLGITAKAVQRGLENKLRVQAAGGIDVSGYIPYLQEIESTTNTLLGNAGFSTNVAAQDMSWVASFITDARAKGKSDAEISAYLASKGITE